MIFFIYRELQVMGITDKNSIQKFESGILMTKQKMYEARHIGISV